jgi:GNAT superfamily N-acetyltransferase
MCPGLTIRTLLFDELSRVAEINRTEHIDVLYQQRGTELVEQHGNWDAPAWLPSGHGDHTVAAKVGELEGYCAKGGVAIGAFDGDALLGIAVVIPHLRPSVAQLAFLHVSEQHRGAGVGVALADEMDRIARGAGATSMVVSATPTGNTVRFYMGRGFRPVAEPDAQLLALEPDDVHMRKAL